MLRALMASSSNILAEYAKSNRSSCKKCGKTIAVNTLRLGVINRDVKGFDTTKWHHLGCFPMESQPIEAAENINGFSSLKINEQETLKKLTEEFNLLQKEITNVNSAKRVDEGQEMKVKEWKVHRLLDSSAMESDVISLKKPKFAGFGTEAKSEMLFSFSDVKDKYKDATLPPKWKAFQTLIFLEKDDGLQDSRKIAAFDFDGCLVKTSVKRVGPNAWSLLYSSIPEKLKSLYDNGYKLVIFTNESNIERWKNKRQVAVDSKIGRLTNFIKQVKVPLQVFIACGLGNTGSQIVDPFRKPSPGMWTIMEQHFNSGIAIDWDQSFYVGDAAGRLNDHSDADIKFAEAVGLKFHVPEEYFGA